MIGRVDGHHGRMSKWIHGDQLIGYFERHSEAAGGASACMDAALSEFDDRTTSSGSSLRQQFSLSQQKPYGTLHGALPSCGHEIGHQ